MLVVPIFGTGKRLAMGIKNRYCRMRHRMNVFSDELTTYSKIKAVTASSEMPGQGFVCVEPGYPARIL